MSISSQYHEDINESTFFFKDHPLHLRKENSIERNFNPFDQFSEQSDRFKLQSDEPTIEMNDEIDDSLSMNRSYFDNVSEYLRQPILDKFDDQ